MSRRVPMADVALAVKDIFYAPHHESSIDGWFQIYTGGFVITKEYRVQQSRRMCRNPGLPMDIESQEIATKPRHTPAKQRDPRRQLTKTSM